MLPWMLTSMDIPSGADVDAYRHENFEGPAISWSKTSTSAFLKSFRTRWQNETMPEPKPLDHVTLYSGGYASNATLSMTAGQAVPTTSFLWQTFQFGFFGVEVPQGLVLLSYLQPSFDGPYTIFRRGFHSYPPQLIPSRLNSFLVLHETDPLPAQTPTNVPEVVCQMELDTISIPLGSSYPYIKPEFCSTLKIPPGLTVILFDRPWFLGGYSLWTQVDGEKLPWVWISRMRSLRVVKHEEAPPSMPYSVHDDDYVKSFVWKFASMMFKIGEAVPGVGEYEKRSKTPIAFTIPPGIVLVLCSDFNFEGSCMSYNRSVADDEELLATYKSYKVLRSNESSQDNLTSTDFVGCYPPANPYLSWTPIFLQANDTIDELIYPWDQNILRFTVPRGLVVVAFSGSHFQGECFAWMTDANDIGEWNRKIRSLMVLPASNCKLNGQSVAIKTLADPTSTNIQAFVDEIMYATQLQNPFIVSLIGVAWTTATDLQCVMEYMNLGDLRSYLSSVKSIAWESKVACALSVAEGLFYLHVQQCIHRDVKSRNILLDSVKGAKLGDFGVSKEVIYGDTMTAAVGTLRWMAPEMMLFQPYSSAVDIFSFGVVLSEMSTHEMPYADLVDSSGQSLSEEAIAGCVIHDKLRPSFGKCPPWFKTLGLKCMSEVPQDRPTAVQLIFELKSQLQQLRRRGLSESRSDTHRVEMRNT
ncbi:unnamed protein product [Aphanomyces euteiches]